MFGIHLVLIHLETIAIILKQDVLQLADVFEKFISSSFKNYNLDQCHYFSAPGLSWDAILKMTKVELEKISNADMRLFIEKGMRGGISYVAKRYSKANNKYCPDYDKEKNIDKKYYCSGYYDVSVKKYGVKCGASLRFWENKGWINEIDP